MKWFMPAVYLAVWISSLLFVTASGLGQEVTVYRLKTLAHALLKPSVYVVDGRQVARLQDGRYFHNEASSRSAHVYLHSEGAESAG
jgi:hypothetical protein